MYCCCCRCILHLQQYSRRLNLFFFHRHNASSRATALGLTQPLTQMSTRNISWVGKGGRCVRLTTLPLHVPNVMKSGSLNLLEASGPVQTLPLRTCAFWQRSDRHQDSDFYISVLNFNLLQHSGDCTW